MDDARRARYLAKTEHAAQRLEQYNGLWDQVALDSADRLAEGLPTVLEVMDPWTSAA